MNNNSNHYQNNQHYHQIRHNNQRHSHFNRHNNNSNQHFQTCHNHSNRDTNSRHTFHNPQPSQAPQFDNLYTNEFPTNDQANSNSLITTVNSALPNTVNTDQDPQAFAEQFLNFLNEPNTSSNRQYSYRADETSSSYISNDTNCLNSNYVPPNAQISYLPRQQQSQRSVYQSNRFGGSSQREDGQQPRYIPSAVASNCNSHGHDLPAHLQRGNSSRHPHNHNHHSSVHNSYTRLWHEQQNRAEMQRFAGLMRR